jgi:rhamnogalacturonan endolyase
MKTIRIAYLFGLLISLAALSNFVPGARMHDAPGVFGYTDIGTAYQVDTGAGLVFHVRKTDGSIISIVFNGTEYKSTTNRFSQIASGLGTPTTVTPETDGATYVKITLQTDNTNGVAANLTHYLIVRNGENTIYMATFPTNEPGGELRWITRLNSALIPDGPQPSDLHGTIGAIESTDIFGNADGTTRSKYYGDNVLHGKDRAIDLTYSGATGPGIGCWMVFGNRESSSGGPFFRDIENQAGDDQEIYNYMNSGHNQTEPFRLNVLHGPYALVFTDGTPPALPIDFSWLGSLGLNGWVGATDRGTVAGTVNGIPGGFQTVVGFANGTAQYWTIAAADGTYTSAGMKPGTYTATLYKGELEVTAVAEPQC